MYAEEDYLMLSGIQHIAFCERQWCLIHIEQQWSENEYTMEGNIVHKRVDQPFEKEKRGDVILSRATPVSSKTLGLSGILDLVEYRKVDGKGIAISGQYGQWFPRIVEYKSGKKKKGDYDKIQLTAQVIALEEEEGVKIKTSSIYYSETKSRENVEITKELREKTIEYAKRMHELYKLKGTTAAENYKNCKKCSLYDICMPRITKKKRNVKNYIEEAITRGIDDEEA